MIADFSSEDSVEIELVEFGDSRQGVYVDFLHELTDPLSVGQIEVAVVL